MRLMICALVPALAALALVFLKGAKRPVRMTVAVGAAAITSLMLIPSLVHPSGDAVTLFSLGGSFACALKLDRAGALYLGLAAFLWPFATLYAVEYMAHEEKERNFFSWYLIAYAVVILLAASANLFTLYVFYELLTLVTVPLVWHKRDKRSIRAARMYLLYLVGGAALGFMAMVTAGVCGADSFVLGGAVSAGKMSVNFLLAMAVLGFIGFGAKSAVFPMSRWLPRASVAPTPVTALLHAVAVVNAGIFSVLRLIYYTFGADFLRGTWAQVVMMLLATITVLYGALRAVREPRLKQRMAWSTVSNLSYMLIGLSMMSSAGMTAGLVHMVYHSLMKIVIFGGAGAMLVMTGLENVHDMHGLARRMPFTYVTFTIASLSLTGIPPMIGFISKYFLITSALETATAWSLASAVALVVSELLSAIYDFSVIIPAWCLPLDKKMESAGKCDPGPCMKISLGVLSACVLAGSAFVQPLVRLISSIAA